MQTNEKNKFTLEISKDLAMKKLPAEIASRLVEVAYEKYQDEKNDRETFEKYIQNCSNEEIKIYIPDVYQKDIYRIDYIKLWENGIRLISFDIDDTINDIFINKIEAKVPGIKVKMPKDAKELFAKLKSLGFTVTLLTNAGSDLAKAAAEELDADGYIARANKPESMNFKVMQQQYGMEKSQMAHVGNDIRTDIMGGNDFGIITCLVRRKGFAMKVVKYLGKKIGIPTKGKLIKNELLNRGLWRKHHLKEKEDQYYQLGEIPKYLR